ncbi:MAG TPA: hypothetical protein VFZ40_16140 [Pyrinomonadaceae bacterium]
MRGKRLTTQSRSVETYDVPAESRIRLAADRLRALRRRNYVEDLAVKSDVGLCAITKNRRRLLAAVLSGLVTTSFVWLAAMSFPYEASSILWNGFNWGNRLLTILVMSIPFTPPFITVFAFSNLLFPSAPEPDVALGVMSTFSYRQTSDRRWFIIIVSAMFGALNCFLLVIALSNATGN